MALWQRLLNGRFNRGADTAPSRRLRVFVSYGREPKDQAALVRQMCRDLAKKGFDVWFDERIEVGDAWRRAIIAGLRTSEWTLAFVSAHAMRSGSPCLDEIALSMNLRPGTLSTVLLDPEIDAAAPATISHLQRLDLSAWRSERAKGRNLWRRWYNAQLAAVNTLLTDPNKARLTRQIPVVEARLGPLLEQSHLIVSLVNGFVGREWLADFVNDWRLHRQTERVMLMTGPPGIGKSSFAAWLTHYARANVVGLTFSQTRFPESLNVNAIIRSLAFQASARLPAYRESLLEALDRYPSIAHADTNPGDLFRWLLIGPLKKSIDGGQTMDRHLLVIDGIDELLPRDRILLAELLANDGDELPAWIGVLVISRPNRDIENRFSKFVPFRIEEHAKENSADTGAYAWHWLSLLRPPQRELPAIHRRVVAAAAGSFQYLVLLRAAVQQDLTRLDAAIPLPRGLEGLYRLWFDRQFPDHAFNDAQRELLGVLAVAENPIPESFLANLFEWADALQKVRMLEPLGSLFERRASGIAPHHASLREWLKSERAAGSEYMVLAERGRVRLTDGLWGRFVASLDESNIPLDQFTIAELPMQLAAESVADLRERLATAGPWPRVVSKLVSIVENLQVNATWLRALAWLELIDRLCEAANDTVLVLRGWAHSQRGEALMLLGDSDEALLAFRAAFDIHQTLVVRDVDSLAPQHELAVDYEKIGDVLVTQGNSTGALEAYNRSLVVRLGLVERDSKNTTWQRAEATVRCKIGDLLINQDPEGALAEYHECLTINEALVLNDPENLYWQHDQLACHQRFGNVLMIQGNIADAQIAYRTSLDIGRKLVECDATNIEWQIDVARSTAKLGNTFRSQGAYEDAMAAYRDYLGVMETLMARDPHNTRWLREVAIGHGLVGDILVAQHDRKGALESFRRSRDIAETLVERDPNNSEWQRTYWVSNEKVGDVLWAQGDLVEGRAAYGRLLAISQSLVKRDPANRDWQRILSVSHQRVGHACKSQGNLEAALTAYQAALDICRDLAQSEPTMLDWHYGVANNLTNIGGVKRLLDDLRGALEAHQEALDIRTQLSSRDASSSTHAQSLIESTIYLGETLLQQGQSAQARDAAFRAVALAETGVNRFPQVAGIADMLRRAQNLLAQTPWQFSLAQTQWTNPFVQQVVHISTTPTLPP